MATSTQTFRSSGTWRRPAGTTSINISVRGGGGRGGGGGQSTNQYSGGGGGGGEQGALESIIDNSPPFSISVTVGASRGSSSAGGATGARGNDGGNGGRGSTVRAIGGSGGSGGNGEDGEDGNPGYWSGDDIFNRLYDPTPQELRYLIRGGSGGGSGDGRFSVGRGGNGYEGASVSVPFTSTPFGGPGVGGAVTITSTFPDPPTLFVPTDGPYYRTSPGSFTQILSAAFGGTEPYAYAVSIASGRGIIRSFDSASRLIEVYIPAPTSTTIVAYAVTDATGVTITRSVIFRSYTSPPPGRHVDLRLPTPSIKNSNIGDAVNVTLPSAQSGGGGYAYIVYGLPPGLRADLRTVSGSPTTSGSYMVRYSVTDYRGNSVYRAFTWNVSTATSISTSTLSLLIPPAQNSIVGNAVNVTLPNATGGSSPYAYAIIGLPAGLSASGRTITGSPTTSGSYSVTYSVTDSDNNNISRTFTWRVTSGQTALALPAVKAHTREGPGRITITLPTASGGTAPYFYSVVARFGGTLISYRDNVIVVDIATAPRTATVTYQVNDSVGAMIVRTIHLRSIVTPPPDSPPNANAGNEQDVSVGDVVTLDGTGSSDPENDTLAYSWSQTSGPTVVFQNALIGKPTFPAPASPSVLEFQLTVTAGNKSDTDTVRINVIASTYMGVNAISDIYYGAVKLDSLYKGTVQIYP